MEADSGSTQETKPGSPSVSELRAKLSGKLVRGPDPTDESTKSSVRSLDSSLDMPKEEMSPVMKKISQFQTHSPSAVKMVHSRSGSAQPAPSATVLSRHDSGGTADTQHKVESSSNPPSVSSPSVAALRSQLALSPAMLRPADSGPGKIPRNLKRISADSTCSDTLPNTTTTEKPASTVTPTKAASRVSDIQQRLALDPNMLLPSPVSGPPSRGHRRGRSNASPAAATPAPDVSHESQMNRPLIATRSRRSRTSAKFACDEQTTQTFDEIEKLSTQLDNAANAVLLQEQAAETNPSLAVPENSPAELKNDDATRPQVDFTVTSIETLNTESASQLTSVVHLHLDSEAPQSISVEGNLPIGLEQSIVEKEQQVDAASSGQAESTLKTSDLSEQNPVAHCDDDDHCDSASGTLQSPTESKESGGIMIERPSRSSRHRTMDSGLQGDDPLTDSNLLLQQPDPIDEIPASVQDVVGQAKTTTDRLPQLSG